MQDARLALLFKIDRGLVNIDKTGKLKQPNRLSRNMHTLSYQIPSAQHDYRKFSFLPRTVKEWNNLPPDIVTVGTPDAFRAQVSKIFI